MKNATKAHIALIIVNLLYGANYIIAKEVMPEFISPFGLIFIRVSMGVLLFWLFHLIVSQLQSANTLLQKKIDWVDYPKLLLCSLFGVAINQSLFLKGLSLTAPINASLIMITTPILVLVIAAILIKEKITPVKLLGIVLGTIGAATLIWFSQKSTETGHWLGDLFIFLNASSYALYLVIVKPLMSKYHPFTLIKWIFLFGWFFITPFSWGEFSTINWVALTTNAWLGVFYVVLGATFFTYLFNIYALQIVSPSIVSAYIYTQPVIATTIAVFLGKDSISPIKTIAAILIFIGVFLVSQNFQKKK